MAISTKSFKKKRLFKVAKELNIQTDHIESFLNESGHGRALKGTGIMASITSEEAYHALLDKFKGDRATAERVERLREEQARADELAETIGDFAPVEIEDVEPQVVPEASPPITVAPEEKQDGPTIDEVIAREIDVSVPPLTLPAAEETPAAPGVEKPPSAAEPTAAPTDASTETPTDTPEAVKPEVVEPEAEMPEIALPDAEPGDASEATKVEPPAPTVPMAEELPPAQPDSEAKAVTPSPAEGSVIKAADKVNLQGTTVVGKMDLKTVDEKKPTEEKRIRRKRKRKGTRTTVQATTETKSKSESAAKRKKSKRRTKSKVDSGAVGQTVQETLREVEHSSSRVRQRRRRARRQQRAEERLHESREKAQQERKVRVTEFISTGQLAELMDTPVTDVISMLFNAGMVVSINQRLDADTISFVADEFEFEVEFITEFGTEDIELEEDRSEDLVSRAPVVTVMGHVDHGKTSLLDYIRRATVAIGESGGITQHIGAYKVYLDGGRVVTFLDTPGHEAFTAMRARGAKVTDIVILVVAADDAVMPQTIEAINHARAAEVAVIVAINKIDLADSDPKRVMQQLSDHGVLVEQYGGQVQCANVSAKTGQGVDDLLEKVLLEADIQELKGNPDRRAQGIVIESRLDRGRGNVATVLVQNGTLKVGDPFVAGIYGGKVRAMFDESDQRIKQAGPSEPALVLGLPGQPTVGDQFIGFDDADEAKHVAQRRQQIWRIQQLRQYKHVRLEDIGRRMALGDISELNLIIKADVGGSVEALSDALLKLSTDEVAVNIVHSGVGAINDSDVMLASASDAIIIGFQVRPTTGARHASEREEIDIHTYSIIYDAIEDVRDALEGLLQPEETERVTGSVEVRELFKVPKVGTVAGCYVIEGKVRRNDTVRILRESVVIYNGTVSSLRRFKEDVREVVSGYECGIGIANYNDLKVGDQFEVYEIVELKRTLD